MLVSKICTTILSLIIIGLTLTDVKEEISGNDCKRHIKRTAGCMNQVLSNQTLTDRKQWKCKRHLPVIEVCFKAYLRLLLGNQSSFNMMYGDEIQQRFFGGDLRFG